MMRNMFKIIDILFRPKNSTDIDRLDPISIKKLKKGDVIWSTKKTVLGWSVDTFKQVLTLPLGRKYKLTKVLVFIPPPILGTALLRRPIRY